MSIRRLNYTKRKKLTLDQVHIALSPAGQGRPRSFTADLKLPAGLPGDARVFVEAYRSSPASRMRFDFGTVAALQPPDAEQCCLTEFDDDLPPPLFRIKITDTNDQPGRLVADAQRIRPLDPDKQPGRQRGILPIAWGNNDGPVWELDLDGASGPVLIIDNTADPDRVLPSTLQFKALVYPEIIRRVLTEVLDDQDSSEDPEGWQRAWLNFPRQRFGFMVPAPTDKNDSSKKDWVDDAVRWCSRTAGFCQALAPKETDE